MSISCFPNLLDVILTCSGSFYEEDYDEDYDYDDNNYIDSSYGTKKEFASSSKKKVSPQQTPLLAALLAGINDFLVAVVEFSFSVHCVQRISLLSFLNSKSASSQWENSLEGEDFI